MRLIHLGIAKSILNSWAAQNYRVSDDCILCGICVRACPVNIIVVTDQVSFSDHCEVCYGCPHNCPKKTIPLKSERSSARFRNVKCDAARYHKIE